MPTVAERLETAVAQTEADSELLNQIVNGSDTTTVTTEGGPVDSIAKTVKDAKLHIGDFLVVDDAAMTAAMKTIETIGYPLGGGSQSTLNMTFFHATAATRESLLETLRLTITTAGNLKIKILGDNGDGTVSLIQEATVVIGSTGNKTLVTGTDFNGLVVPLGGYVALYGATSGGARFAYTVGSSAGPDYYGVSGEITATSSKGSATAVNTLNFDFDLASAVVEERHLSEELADKIAAGETALALVENFADVTTENIGNVNPGGPNTTAVVISTVNIKPGKPGVLSGLIVDITSVNSGAIIAQKVRVGLDGTISILATANLTISGTGEQTLTAGVGGLPIWTFAIRETVAIQTVSGGATLRYSAVAGPGYWYYIGIAAGSNQTFSLTVPGAIYYQIVLNPYAKVKSTAKTCLYETISSFGTLPTGWSNDGSSWTFGSGKATSGTIGLANQLRTGYQYGDDRRIMREEIRITNASTEYAFLTNPIEGAIRAGSLVSVNSADNLFRVYRAYNGGSTLPAVLDSTGLGFTLATGRTYIVEWEKNGRSFTFRIWDKSGNGFFSYTRTATPWGFSTYPSFGYDQGTMQGAPGVAILSGSGELYSFDHRAIGSPTPVLKGFGDSISEKFAVTDAQGYWTLIRDEIGAENFHMSGIGGAVTSGALARMKSELLHMTPDYVFIYLGSNSDGSFAANLLKIYAIIIASDAIPIVCTVPTNTTATTAVNNLPAEALKVDFALALTVSGAGSTKLSPLYDSFDANGNPYSDVHPNSTGHYRMAQRIKLNVPQLFR